MEIDLDPYDPRRLSLAVIGPGRLGSVLSRSLLAAGWRVELVMGSSPSSHSADSLARELGCRAAESVCQVAKESDVVLLCVPDAALESVVEALAEASKGHAGERTGQRYVGHTAGSCGVGVLAPLSGLGWQAFALHPAASIADRRAGPEILRGRHAAVTAPGAARRLALTLAQSLGLRPFEVSEEERPAYHLACATASNYMVTLAAAAERVLQAAGVDVASDVLVSLMQSVLDNLRSSSPVSALTGPIARGDVPTVARHLQTLGDRHPEFLELYSALARSTVEIASLPESRRQEMYDLLDSYGTAPSSLSAAGITTGGAP